MEAHPVPENSITKFTQIIERQDGSEVKLVACAYFGTGLHMSVGVDVFRRANANENWSLCSDRPDPRWREMSVDDYIKNGRSEMLQVVSPGEILKVAGMIGKPFQEAPSGQVNVLDCSDLEVLYETGSDDTFWNSKVVREGDRFKVHVYDADGDRRSERESSFTDQALAISFADSSVLRNIDRPRG